jgi:deoxyribodipyrimidine photo-lyase
VTRALVLFTRDLRVRDQPALAAAAREAQQVIPAFVIDRQLLAGACAAPNRLAFLLDCLHDLDRSLRARGAALVVRRGDPVEEALALAHRWHATAIHVSADSTPYARLRHERLARACGQARIELRTHPGVNLLAPGQLTPAGGDHYRVFTPYLERLVAHATTPARAHAATPGPAARPAPRRHPQAREPHPHLPLARAPARRRERRA